MPDEGQAAAGAASPRGAPWPPHGGSEAADAAADPVAGPEKSPGPRGAPPSPPTGSGAPPGSSASGGGGEGGAEGAGAADDGEARRLIAGERQARICAPLWKVCATPPGRAAPAP